MESSNKKYFSSTRIAVLAMFSALAGILYIFNFSLSFAFPSFLEFNFADIPALIGSFALGPVSGAIIVAMRILIKLVVKSTSTMFVGELSDLITGCAFAVTAGFIYSKKRTFKGALIGMAVGAATEVTIAILFNWLILVPFYVEFFFHGKWEPLIGMMNVLFPNCTKENFYNYYLWVSVLPFNLMRCIVAVLVTLPVYKRISKLINNFNAKLQAKESVDGEKVRKINLGAIIAAIAVIVILVVFVPLRVFVFK